ncbi:hypothetical protein M8818_002643 [Zalaria obscura]|uniref:Uncharacterized protein n=1 Tax=Zalaria obscura TaxID=2024903 RepID=A0ACC3SID9_9PEZI
MGGLHANLESCKSRQEPDGSYYGHSKSCSAAAVAAEIPTAQIVDEPASVPYQMRESRVPSSRFGRLWQYGGLATSMAFGAVGESLRRVTGSGADGSLMLSEANMERLVAKLSRMRGAALKLGQMMSFQDSKMLPPAINTVLQRVQDRADYMPPSQRNKVLTSSLGKDWRDLFSSFEDQPIAAASIGQVHRAVLASTGEEVAVKIQYPGVRSSIDSDLNNLSLLLTAKEFIEPYVRLLIAASKGDREACRDLSITLGYLTGAESKTMLDAHVASVLTLAEPFMGTSPEGQSEYWSHGEGTVGTAPRGDILLAQKT